MAKTKKKRTKRYQGHEAAARPTITRVQAVSRSRPHQWWYERRRIIKPILFTVLVVVALVLIISQAITLLTR